MSKKALIVDDEPDIRELLEITLGRMDIETRSAADVTNAKSLLEEETFDFCLTDMNLPDGNGIELVQHISDTVPGMPVAMITAHGSMDSAVEALKAGAFDFVSKPVNLELLRNLVDIEINRKQTPEKAMGYLELLIAIQPESGKERFQRAILRVQDDNIPGAREDLDWLMENQPPGLDYRRLEQFRDSLPVQ